MPKFFVNFNRVSLISLLVFAVFAIGGAQKVFAGFTADCNVAPPHGGACGTKTAPTGESSCTIIGTANVGGQVCNTSDSIPGVYYDQNNYMNFTKVRYQVPSGAIILPTDPYTTYGYYGNLAATVDFANPDDNGSVNVGGVGGVNYSYGWCGCGIYDVSKPGCGGTAGGSFGMAGTVHPGDYMDVTDINACKPGTGFTQWGKAVADINFPNVVGCYNATYWTWYANSLKSQGDPTWSDYVGLDYEPDPNVPGQCDSVGASSCTVGTFTCDSATDMLSWTTSNCSSARIDPTIGAIDSSSVASGHTQGSPGTYYNLYLNGNSIASGNPAYCQPTPQCFDGSTPYDVGAMEANGPGTCAGSRICIRDDTWSPSSGWNYPDSTNSCTSNTCSSSCNGSGACTVVSPVTGVCNNAAAGACTAGTESNPVTNGNTTTWTCSGSCTGGNSSPCSYTIPSGTPSATIISTPATCVAPCSPSYSWTAANFPNPQAHATFYTGGTVGNNDGTTANWMESLTPSGSVAGGSGSATPAAAWNLSAGSYTYCIRAVNGNWSTSNNLACATTNVTAPCGASGQTCCSGNVCNSNLACSSGGICTACGASGQTCCSGNVCNSDLSCSNGTCNPTASVTDSIWADSTSVNLYNSTIIHWTVANSTSAVITSSPSDSQFNNRSTTNTSGEQDNTGNLTQTTVYTITAQGPGGPAISSVTVTVLASAPTCTSVSPQSATTYNTSGTFNIDAYGVTNATGVTFYTWSAANGQDDLFAYPGVNLGGGHWQASVNLANHRAGNPDYGLFYSDVYMQNVSYPPLGSYGLGQYCNEATFTRVGSASISLSSLSNVSANVGASAPSSQSLIITNNGTGSLNWTASVNNSAVCSVSPASGSGIAAGGYDSTAVNFLPPTSSLLGSNSCVVTITDNNNANDTKNASAIYTVTSPAPTANLTVTVHPNGNTDTASNGGSVYTNAANDTPTLTWSSTNAASCTLTSNNSDSKSGTSGSGVAANSLGNDSGSGHTWVYTLSCSGSGGNVSTSVNVIVPPAPPTVTATCPSPGTAATLSWTAPSGFTNFYVRNNDLTSGTGLSWNENYAGTTYAIPNSYSGQELPGSPTVNHNYSMWVHTRASNGAYSTSAGVNYTCQPIVCPAGNVSLSSSSILVGQNTTASAPSGWSGGSYNSSNSGVASVSGSTINGIAVGSVQVSGYGWNAPGGAKGCGLNNANLTVSSNGACGTANGKIYANGTTGGYGTYTQCSSGNSSNTSFPSAGNTISWTCSGTNGGNPSGTCSASQAGSASISLSSLSNVSANVGASAPSSQSLIITNNGTGSLNWTASVNNSAVCSVSPASGSGIAAGGYDSTAVNFLPPTSSLLGNNSCVVTITDSNNASDTQNASATYTVYSGPPGDGGGSSNITVTPQCSAGNNPQNLVQWTAGSGATSYNIYRSQTSTIPGSPTYSSISALSYTDATNVTAGGTYYYWVESVGGGGTKVAASSNPVTANTCVIPPSQAGGGNACNSAMSSCPNPPGGNASGGIKELCGYVRLSWQDTNSGTAAYKLYKDGVYTGVTTAVGATFVDYQPGDTNSHTYGVAATKSGVDSAVYILSTNNPVAVISCSANLNDSDKNIIAVNGVNVSPAPGQCNGFVPLPSGYSLKVGDNLKFRIDLCNDQGNGTTTNITVTDTMQNLQAPSGGWGAQYCVAGGSCNSVSPVASGASPNQTLTFTLPNNSTYNIPTGGGATLAFTAQLPASSSSANQSRFQNSFNIIYNGAQNFGRSTPWLPYYTGKGSPTINEVP